MLQATVLDAAPRSGDGRSDVTDHDAMARMRDAMRDLMNPSEHLTIVDTGSMIVLTGPDGRTTRLSPDGRKIKDENTGIERRNIGILLLFRPLASSA